VWGSEFRSGVEEGGGSSKGKELSGGQEVRRKQCKGGGAGGGGLGGVGTLPLGHGGLSETRAKTVHAQPTSLV